MLGRRSRDPDLAPINLEVEKSLRALRALTSRVANLSISAPMAEEQEQKPALKDHFTPNDYTNPSCIQMPAATGHFEIKPSTISYLPNFYRKSNEDPYQHLNEFNDLCTTLMSNI